MRIPMVRRPQIFAYNAHLSDIDEVSEGARHRAIVDSLEKKEKRRGRRRRRYCQCGTGSRRGERVIAGV